MYDHILVALDGSKPSECAGRTAMAIAIAHRARVTACHVYGAEMHRQRFVDMEPGLPRKYQEPETLTDLRTAHDSLTYEGFRALSTGYIEDFVADCRNAGVTVQAATIEGRSYTGIIRLAEKLRVDLIAMGANGLGEIGDAMLGGTTSRVLNSAPCDVLVARKPPHDGPVLAGIDGSEAAIRAAQTAADIARTCGTTLNIAAAYDPDFHTHVFGTMAGALSAQRQSEVGLANQEKLHDDIINDGLGKLYREFLLEAHNRLADAGAEMTTSLLTGKAYHAVDAHARECNASLIVINRYGHHREPCSRLGSNAENILRTTNTNVLLVGGVTEMQDEHEESAASAEITNVEEALTWDTDAEARLQRVPSFVRNMAKRTIEIAVRDRGKQHVGVEDFDSVAARFGMGGMGGAG